MIFCCCIQQGHSFHLPASSLNTPLQPPCQKKHHLRHRLKWAQLIEQGWEVPSVCHIQKETKELDHWPTCRISSACQQQPHHQDEISMTKTGHQLVCHGRTPRNNPIGFVILNNTTRLSQNEHPCYHNLPPHAMDITQEMIPLSKRQGSPVNPHPWQACSRVLLPKRRPKWVPDEN